MYVIRPLCVFLRRVKEEANFHFATICHSGQSFCSSFFLAVVNNDDYNQRKITIIYQGAEIVIFPLKQSTTPFVFYLHEAKRGFIFQCLYHSKVSAKPAKLFSLLSPCSPSPPLSAVWHVKTSCLVAARIDVERRCALIQGPPYLPAVFSGLCRGVASQQDDPSCWPHTPEPCVTLNSSGSRTLNSSGKLDIGFTLFKLVYHLGVL